MELNATLSIFIIVCIAIIAYLIYYINSIKAQHSKNVLTKIECESQLSITQQQLADLKGFYENLTIETNNLRVENSRLNERIRYTEEEKERLTKESEIRFKNLANEILTHNTIAFKEQNESRLAEILTPLKENIEQFKKTVADSYSNEARERYSLQERIKELIELNQSIGKEAKDLAIALKGNSKTQGNWGEMILENILTQSGLEKGREFFVQETTYNDDGKRLIADIVINYPDGRKIVIDSKVSLTAYVDLVNCESEEEQESLRKRHITSIRNHINELKTKNYQDYLGTEKAEFVMMFIPNESAYICAMQYDHNVWQEAYNNRVLIISPTHLISVLKLIEQIWRHDRQTRNAIEIATESGKMYDKLVGFIEDLQQIEKSLNSAKNSYDDAIKKLSTGNGNLIGKAEKLKNMGAKASKSLPSNLITNN